MVGEELGSYRVVRAIGKGGMASVYVGEHRVLGHRVAIKMLHPKHLANASIERRFFNEARAIAKIRHPGVVQIFDFGRGGPDGLAYIVMEYLEGETLRRRIRAGVMSEKQVAAFGRQIASGLAAAHAAGIIHRDLKPDNVFLIRDHEVELGERAKVLDFGIAKQVDFNRPVAQHTAAGILVGTPAYMSPEQCRGHGEVDGRADIYSLGVVLYRMVTNQLPFESAETGELIGKHLQVAPAAPIELNRDLSKEMSEVILSCLEKDPDRRPQTMQEVAEALRPARISPAPADRRGGLPPTSAPAASPEEETHPTTLRTASGESRPPEPVLYGFLSQRGLVYAGLAAVALVALILIGTVPRGKGKDAAKPPPGAGAVTGEGEGEMELEVDTVGEGGKEPRSEGGTEPEAEPEAAEPEAAEPEAELELEVASESQVESESQAEVGPEAEVAAEEVGADAGGGVGEGAERKERKTRSRRKAVAGGAEDENDSSRRERKRRERKEGREKRDPFETEAVF